MELIKRLMFKKTKTQDSNLVVDIEITKEELRHYPHHVLCRALLGACRLLNELDPEGGFVINEESFFSEKKTKEASRLALSMTNNIMNIYLENKDEIDQALKKELH